VVVLGAGGLLGIYQEMSKIALAIHSSNWPTAPGVIVESEPGQIYTNSSSRPVWVPRVLYAFSTSDFKYENDQIAFGDLSIRNDEDSVKVFLKDYPKGKSVLVYFNPKSPADSVLIPGTRAATWSGLIFCLVFLLGVACIFRAVSKQDFSKETCPSRIRQ